MKNGDKQFLDYPASNLSELLQLLIACKFLEILKEVWDRSC